MTKQPEFQSEYFRGLENLRKLIHSIESDIDRAKYDHYDNPEGEEDVYEKRVKDWNTKLLYCNSKLRKQRVSLEVLDSELRLMELINRMRELVEKGQEIDEDVISFLTEHWEKMKEAAEKLRAAISKFRTSVLQKLQVSRGQVYSTTGQYRTSVLQKLQVSTSCQVEILHLYF